MVVSSEDDVYMHLHGDAISRALSEAVAAAVHNKAADPVTFLREHFSGEAAKEAEAKDAQRMAQLEELRRLLEAERGERRLMEERVSALEAADGAGATGGLADGASVAFSAGLV